MTAFRQNHLNSISWMLRRNKILFDIPSYINVSDVDIVYF